MKIVIIGNTKTCAYCTALAKVTAGAEFEAWLAKTGTKAVDADKTKAPALYARWVKAAKLTGSFTWPQVVVAASDGTVKGVFSGRGMTASKLIAKIETYCTKMCPTCNGTGKVFVTDAVSRR